MSRRRPRVLVLNQYYWPGVEATAHLLSDLTRELVKEFDVTVITALLRGVENEAGQFDHAGVNVIRVRSTAYDRALLPLRALNYVSYMLQALRHGLRQPRPDVVFCMTDPPMIADIGLVVSRRHRVPLIVVSQDVFPEVAVELGRLESRALVGLLRALVNYYLRRADRVVAIGETMRARLEEKGTSPERITVIPNWVDTRSITPQPRKNAWARDQGLVDNFVVMHSGNVGHAQNLDALIRAGAFLRDLADLRILIIGTGARHAELEALARRLDVDTVRFLPYQPRELLSQSLSSASVHNVGLAPGLSGYVVPSRIYGILSAGRPVLVNADDDSETAQLVNEIGCGIVVPPARPELLAHAIRRAYSGELDLEAMGARGREYVVRETDRLVATQRYRKLIRETVGG